MDAARAALAAMTPPVSEARIADDTVNMMITLFWSQYALAETAVPSPSPVPPAGVGSMFVQPIILAHAGTRGKGRCAQRRGRGDP